jgi:hypothetical protein
MAQTDRNAQKLPSWNDPGTVISSGVSNPPAFAVAHQNQPGVEIDVGDISACRFAEAEARPRKGGSRIARRLLRRSHQVRASLHSYVVRANYRVDKSSDSSMTAVVHPDSNRYTRVDTRMILTVSLAFPRPWMCHSYWNIASISLRFASFQVAR